MNTPAREIPVYLFTGFLEAGKTKFIQETFEDPRFNNGENTLLLVCEEGIEEYDPSRFKGDMGSFHAVNIDSPDELTTDYLSKLQDKYDIDRVVVEYNGMWMLDRLYSALPDGWLVYQEILFAEAGTFLNYNANMRSLVYDKLKAVSLWYSTVRMRKIWTSRPFTRLCVPSAAKQTLRMNIRTAKWNMMISKIRRLMT